MKQDSTAQQSSAPVGNDSTFGSVFGEGEGSQINAGGAGEFGKTTFGDTNAIGDIFKGSSFGDGDKRKKLMLLGGGLVLVCGLAWAAWTVLNNGESTDTTSESIEAPSTAIAPPAVAAAAAEEQTAEDALAGEEEGEEGATDAATAEITNGGSYTYNETLGGPVVKVPNDARIEVSRKSDFSALYVSGTATNGEFRIPNPPPGNIYWRVEGQDAQKIDVLPPKALSIAFTAPSTLASGGALNWSAEGSASYYKVEVANDASFGSMVAVIPTAKNSAALNGTGAGKYYIRVAGFNEQAGRWEYSRSSPIEVQ